jgi:DNA-binding CsgD family transcriptional regulator
MTVLLQDRTLSAVRRLLAAEPEVGTLLPNTALEAMHQLIGCDETGIGETDQTGYRLRALSFPSVDLGDPQVCDGPLPTGLIHDAELPESARNAPDLSIRDLIRFGFKTGRGTVVQLWFSRQVESFSERELALLKMVEPAVGRLVRECAWSQQAGTLSASERGVLTLVAKGATNREVAEELYVTVHTVRKHLENAYRKLGVTNRTAAAQQLRAGS